jgi:peptidyl-prolyl cis-trans isomerase B (cyclophilin B)
MANRSSSRDRARRAARDDVLRRRVERSARRRRIIAIGAVIVVLMAVGGTIFAAANSTSTDQATASSTTSSGEQSSTTVDEGPTVSAPPAKGGAAISGPTPCPAEDGSSPRTTQFSQAPPTCIDPSRIYDAIVSTSQGSFTFFLNTKLAPRAVNNFIVLARYHYYDGTTVSSITPDTVMQAGAVTNAGGAPGPGYTMAGDYPPGGTVITPGTLGMASLPGGTDIGGEFIITLGAKEAGLPPTTTIMGLMLDDPGNTLHKMNELGTTSGGPKKLVTIESVRITLAPVTSTTAVP